MQPQENPARVLLGLHCDSTEGFILKNLFCLEWSNHLFCLYLYPYKQGAIELKFLNSGHLTYTDTRNINSTLVWESKKKYVKIRNVQQHKWNYENNEYDRRRYTYIDSSSMCRFQISPCSYLAAIPTSRVSNLNKQYLHTLWTNTADIRDTQVLSRYLRVTRSSIRIECKGKLLSNANLQLDTWRPKDFLADDFVRLRPRGLQGLWLVKITQG